MQKIQWHSNIYKDPQAASFPAFTSARLKQVMHFHQTIPGYSPTPLVSLASLANYLGVADILVKDESPRFGLNSFKGLGSSFAVGTCLAKECREKLDSFPHLQQTMKSRPIQTFATATDGNHGRGIAWAARQFGQKAVVYMPKGSSPFRLNKIREAGAQADFSTLNYDDTVRMVSNLSRENGWILVQDTAWEGYTDIPTLIMQGYLTIVGEFAEQLKAKGKEEPTHVILQAGVGSFGGAIAAGLQQMAKNPITFIIVEPVQADCLYQSARAKEGTPQKATGDLSTIMAGLSCGEPNPIAWDILKHLASCFITCPDTVPAKGMRVLGNPLESDSRIISGESGAVPLGLLFELCKNPALIPLKESIGLTSSSRVFFISTEGDTDPENYRAVCWDGKYATL